MKINQNAEKFRNNLTHLLWVSKTQKLEKGVQWVYNGHTIESTITVANTVRTEDFNAYTDVTTYSKILLLTSKKLQLKLGPLLLMKGGIPRKGLIAHWQNSNVLSQVIVVSTFLSTKTGIQCNHNTTDWTHTLAQVSPYKRVLMMRSYACTVLEVWTHCPTQQHHVQKIQESYTEDKVHMYMMQRTVK